MFYIYKVDLKIGSIPGTDNLNRHLHDHPCRRHIAMGRIMWITRPCDRTRFCMELNGWLVQGSQISCIYLERILLSPLYLLRLGNEGLGGRWGDYNMDFSFVGFKFGMAGKKEDVWVYVIPTSG